MYRFLLALILPGLVHAAGDGPLDRATLRGLQAVGVVVDRLAPELEQAGLTQDALRSAVEARLQSAGIRVDPKAVEFLGVRLAAIRPRRAPYTLCIDLGLYQPVLLARDRDTRTATQTWEVDTILVAQPKLLFRESTKAAGGLADRFVKAWLSANPR